MMDDSQLTEAYDALTRVIVSERILSRLAPGVLRVLPIRWRDCVSVTYIQDGIVCAHAVSTYN